MLEIFFIDTRTIDPDSPQIREVCSAKRRAKLERLKNPQAKRSCAGAELAMIKAVRHFYPNAPLPLRYFTNAQGKPYLSDYPQLYINVSHSGNWAVCAASDIEVGIDIQRYKKIPKNFSQRFFSPDECAYIGDIQERFFEIWAKKEAYVKALGIGITVPLKSFSVLEMPECFTQAAAPEADYAVWICQTETHNLS